jgi:hypothetical protein
MDAEDFMIPHNPLRKGYPLLPILHPYQPILRKEKYKRPP